MDRPAQPVGGAAAMFDIAEYWRLAVKHRFLLIGGVLAALAIGLIATLMMTPIYSASTTLQIDREAARVLDVEDVAPRESMASVEEFFQTQYGLLRSRSLAERVVDEQGLAGSNRFLEQMGVEPPAQGPGQATQRRETVIGLVQGGLTVSPVRGSRLVTLTFDSPDPVLSARVANAFAENFIQSNLDRKYESSSYARQFLEERIGQTRNRLEEAERALVAYAASQQIVNVQEDGETGASVSLAANSLVAINSRLAEARAGRVAAEAKWRQAQSANLFTLPEVLQNPSIQRMTEQRATLQAEYQEKSRIYQPEWPELVQLRAQIEELNGQINTIAGGIRNSIRNQYQVAASEEGALQAQVNGLKGDVLDLRDRSVQYNILQREVDTSRTLYDGLLQRYKEVGVTGGVTTNNVSIVDTAKVPTAPSKPNMVINLALALMLGLGAAAAAALLMEALDETLASPDDVESKLHLPVLGVIPLLAKGVSPLEALEDIRSPFAEAYYSLRTALQFSTPEGAPRTLLVTSSRPSEGKSTTAYATALNLARVGKKVLLVDGDLRNPSMHRTVGVENEAGVSNVLAGAASLAELAQPTREPNLSFVPCGPIPPNPAELWGGDRLRQSLEDAGRVYDHIIIDGPPVLGFADAPLLAAAVGGTVFVLESKATRRAQARGALRRLTMGDSRVLGGVLTKFNAQSLQYGGYEYAYDYNYGATDRKRPGKSKRR